MKDSSSGGANPIFGKVSTEISPAHVELRPSPVIPPDLPPAPPQRGYGRLVIGLIGASAVTFALWAFVARRGGGTKSLPGQALRTATVERRDFVRTLRLQGTVEAVQSYTVSAPLLAVEEFSSLVITKLAPAGARVKKGDLLVEFDRQKQVKAFLDKQAEYRDLEEQNLKKQAEEAAARAKDETELKQAEDAVETARLEMRKNEVISRIDAEKNRENLEEAQARVKQLRETFALKRRAAAAEIHVLEIQRDRARNAMLHTQQNAERMAIHAPLDGLVVLNTIWKGGRMAQVQEGDQVNAGQPFLQLVNPEAMQVQARVNQADVPYLRLGQPVQVRLDAYPDLMFPGKLEQLAAIGVGSGLSDKVRIFPAIFSIEGSDPKLLPDLSAAVDVQLERRPQCLLAPRDAVVTEHGQAYVRVKSGAGFEKRAVKTGPINDVEVVIESGVEAGIVVLLGTGAAAAGT